MNRRKLQLSPLVPVARTPPRASPPPLSKKDSPPYGSSKLFECPSMSESSSFHVDLDASILELETPMGDAIFVSPRGANITPRRRTTTITTMVTTSQPSPPQHASLVCICAFPNEEANFAEYVVGHVLGRGSQSVVRKARHAPTGLLYAVKSIDLVLTDPVSVQQVLQAELSRLTASAHPNIIHYHNAFFFENKIKIIMDYMDLGSLSAIMRQIAGSIPCAPLSEITAQMCEGLAHLHQQSILHRDMKPSNVLLSCDGTVKIADFGLSTVLLGGENTALAEVGSASYMSPERLRGEAYGSPADIWGLGITCAECAMGVFPLLNDDSEVFEGDMTLSDRMNLFDLAITIGENRAHVKWDLLSSLIDRLYPGRTPPQVSQACKDFVHDTMQCDPSTRPSAEQLRTHHFLPPGGPPQGGIAPECQSTGACTTPSRTSSASSSALSSSVSSNSSGESQSNSQQQGLLAWLAAMIAEGPLGKDDHQ